MKTTSYNPSALEVEVAEIIEKMVDHINSQLVGRKIVSVKHDLLMDNPQLYFTVEDNDGDLHELAIRLIQKPDDYVS